MNSPQPLLSLDAALAQLLAHASAIPETQTLPTLQAQGRVLAKPLVSDLQVPGFDNSAMDGYALRSADVPAPGVQLHVTQRIAAGSQGARILPGTAARIFTGAPIPLGADAVVMQEDCTLAAPPDALTPEAANQDSWVRVHIRPQPGQNIRRAGEDIRQGATVLPRGTHLGSAQLGLAASIGVAQLCVVRRPKVALFSTGDELVMPGAVAPHDMPPGAIYNSNRFFLHALLVRLGCDVTDYGIVPDQREATVAALRDASRGHDVILTSGGVSVGEEDHVKPAVQALGQLSLWQIAIKPGKPFAYGSIAKPATTATTAITASPGVTAGDISSNTAETMVPQDVCHFIGLPGNPVSSWVTFLLLVRPFLLALQGQSPDQFTDKPISLRADFVKTKADSRREFLRARRNVAGGLDVFPNPSSGVLTSVAWADGLVDVQAGRTIAAGDMVPFLPFADLLS
jgi:molybdopterin molybdotransferase